MTDQTNNPFEPVDASAAHEPETTVGEPTLGDTPVPAHAEDKMTPEKFGELALKFASETAYAAAGFANVVTEKAKDFFEQQKQQYAETHPDASNTESSRAFLDQLSEQVNKLVDDLGKGYKDMAERGRDVVGKINVPPLKTDKKKDQPGPFDLHDAADASAEDMEAAPANGSVEIPIDETTETVVIEDLPTVSPETETDQEQRHF